METTQQEPGRYGGFDGMPVGGTWRAVRSGTRAVDVDPSTGETLVEIPLADARDVDDAYRAAGRTQPGWANAMPQVRRDVLERAVAIMERRKQGNVDWLIRESGSTRIKAS